MKKSVLFLISFFRLTTLLSYSQSDSIYHIPSPKTFMIEFGTSLIDNPNVFLISDLKDKYNMNRNTAIGIGLSINHKNNKSTRNTFDPIHTGAYERYFIIGVNPSITYKLLPNSRLSPYLGLGLSYRNKSTKSKYIHRAVIYQPGGGFTPLKYTEFETLVNGAWRDKDLVNFYQEKDSIRVDPATYGGEQAFNAFGGNFILGVDYSFFRNVYVGVEILIGYELINYKQANFNPITENMDFSLITANKNTDHGSYENASIKMGFWF